VLPDYWEKIAHIRGKITQTAKISSPKLNLKVEIIYTKAL
jgi:hypothetical protein